jgi:two-component system, chemotaxis family, chemotaxis protein CheY
MGHPIVEEDRRKKPRKYTILVVDDQESLRNLIGTFLSKLGHSCVTAIDGVDALDKMKGNKIDAVVSDIKMPNMDGITLTSEISRQYPELPIMIMTAFEKEDTAGLAICAGARDFIKKPFSLNEFSVRLHKMINDSEAQKRMKTETDVDKSIQEFTNDLEPPKQMKREKDVDKVIQEFMNELEPPKQMKEETDVDKVIQEFINDLEPPKQMKGEKGIDDGMRELLDELVANLKKI